jgi:hypothetical protein
VDANRRLTAATGSRINTPTMLRDTLQQIVTLDWTQSRAQAALPCTITIAIALSLLGGLAIHEPAAGMVAAGGAMSVGFGAFQMLGTSRLTPMLWASIGMCISTTAGSLLGHTVAGTTINAVVTGFGCGMLTALSPGVAWIGLQCGIWAIVASNYPADLKATAIRGLFILAGGLLQLALVTGSRAVGWRFHAAVDNDPFNGFLPALRTIWENLMWDCAAFRYAVQIAFALGCSVWIAHLLRLSNGYWVPMTALLVFRPVLHETFARGIARTIGTAIGAVLATVLVTVLQPNAAMLLPLIVLFAWLCYGLVLVNYGVLAICVTGYICFLLAFAGLPESEVAVHRLANTALGGAIALLAYVPAVALARKRTR